MTDRAFFDTNVLVYLFDKDEPIKQAVARDLFVENASRLVVSTQILAEFYVVATRKLKRPMDEGFAGGIVQRLSQFPTVPVDVDVVLAATRTSLANQISLWDAQVVEAASISGCSLLFTEDLAHGAVIKEVRINNPFL